MLSSALSKLGLDYFSLDRFSFPEAHPAPFHSLSQCSKDFWQCSVTSTVLKRLQELSSIDRLGAIPARHCTGYANPKCLRRAASTASPGHAPECFLGILKSGSWHSSAMYLDVVLGSPRSPGLQQRHRAASKASPGHPAAINPIDLQGCGYQLVQLRAAHFIVIPGDRRPMVSSAPHAGHRKRLEHPSGCTHGCSKLQQCRMPQIPGQLSPWKCTYT